MILTFVGRWPATPLIRPRCGAFRQAPGSVPPRRFADTRCPSSRFQRRLQAGQVRLGGAVEPSTDEGRQEPATASGAGSGPAGDLRATSDVQEPKVVLQPKRAEVAGNPELVRRLEQDQAAG